MIAHPPCTRLANSGVRWLHHPPKGRTLDDMWEELEQGVELYKALRDAPINFIALENPVMHKHASTRINPGRRHVVQPWHFGDEAFKATGFELLRLPDLVHTNKLIPPKKGTEIHKNWSFIHRMPPSPHRSKLRSKSFLGMAQAMASQWGNLAI